MNIYFKRAETCKKVSEEEGQKIISSSDNYQVISGQVITIVLKMFNGTKYIPY